MTSVSHKHALEIPWDIPSKFDYQKGLLSELSSFVAVSETRVKAWVTDKKVEEKVLVRADQVKEFISETWGEIGLAILDAIEELYTSISPKMFKVSERIPCGFIGECKLFANTTTLAIIAVCQDESWWTLIDCVLWIKDVLCQPCEGGLTKRGSHKILQKPNVSILPDEGPPKKDEYDKGFKRLFEPEKAATTR